MKIKYELADSSSTRGMKHEGDLDFTVCRRNTDGSQEVVAAFHARHYAEKFAKEQNKQVAEMYSVDLNAVQVGCIDPAILYGWKLVPIR